MLQGPCYPCTKPPEPFRLFAKKEYKEGVKTNSYEINLESKPFDNNVRKPALNWFTPHYNRWGYEKDSPWTTTTSDMLNQRFLLEEETINPNKKIISYYTYHDKLDCNSLEKSSCISQYAVNDYITTMQYSYKPKHKMKLNRHFIKETPFNLNRKFVMKTITASNNKFWDDDHLEEIELLHRYKPDRLISYNFMTGCQSDGTPLPEDRYTKV
ncbi:hypothetical protein WA026_003150 [Henosepilachna vigintioctopunctata]|uniref:Uncharacterized protein n=1 Tax=Henosepilachna vigintioctopunctata TaxID=420089 RepID=A0AAW1TMB2_9CUCU